MKTRSMSLCALAGFCLPALAATITVGAPGTGSNRYPFGGPSGGCWPPCVGSRYQQAYDASSFTLLGPVSITGISFTLASAAHYP